MLEYLDPCLLEPLDPVIDVADIDPPIAAQPTASHPTSRSSPLPLHSRLRADTGVGARGARCPERPAAALEIPGRGP